MRGVKNHIAVLLLGIFLFPQLFQPLHVIWHHVQDEIEAMCVHVCVEQNSGEAINLPDEHCSLCEFQAFPNNLPTTLFFRIMTRWVSHPFPEFKTSPVLQLDFSERTLRAPPAQIV